jgi:iron complex outermembrane receptor protein
MKLKGTFLASVATTCMLIAPPALGQDNTQDDDSAASGLEDIVVTARKRAESAQDVPVVVAAFDSAAIERRAIAGIEDITSVVPGLSLQAPGNPTQNVLNLRGIESGNIGVGFDQPVSINIDGVQFSNAEVLRVGQFDVERIEVLKGPQALFFGKNSPGGVISIQTAKPTDELFVQLRGSLESGVNKAGAEAIVSGPLGAGIGGRLAVSFTDSDGWWVNLRPGVANPKLPQYQEWIVRGTLRAEPTDSLDATLKFTYHRNRGADFLYQDLIGCRADVATYSTFDDCKLNGRGDSPDPSQWAGFNASLSPLWSSEPYTNYATYIGSLELNQKLGEAFTLTSVTGYNVIDNKRFDNIITGGAPQLLFLGEHQYQSSFSQELRLSGEIGPVRMMLGGFFDDRKVRQDSAVVLVGGVLPFFRQQIDGSSYSFFGQAEVDITPQFELSVGGRYTNEKKSWSGEITQANNFVVDGVALKAGDPLRILDPKIQEGNFSPEVTLSFKPSRDVLLYGSYKEGFKSGSFGMSQTAARFLSVRTGTRNSFLSEQVDGYEAGLKSEWFDGTVRFNVVGFDYNYKNLQLSAFDPNTLSTRVFNAGAAKTRGVEVETLFAPRGIEGLTLSANVAYLDAFYQNFFSDCNRTQIDFTGAAGGCNVNIDNRIATSAGGLLAGTGFEAQDRAGDRLRNAPEWVAQLGFTYEREISGKFRLNLNGDATYTSKTNVDILGDPRGINPSRWVINAGVGLSSASRAWAVDLIARNLTNKRFAYFAEHAGLSGGRAFTANINPPRSFMLRITLRPSEIGK